MATNFTDSAKGLARNPLGIIALFISFVYALACIVIAVSTSTLDPYERIPLVYFVIVFPVLTLGCFMWLVIQHPTKLYAPSDYKEDNSFMMTMGVPDSLKKLMPLPMQDGDKATDPVVNLLNSSISGIFFLYAAHLAKEHKMTFTLEELYEQCNVLVPHYTHGFLVAASSIGAITLSSIVEPFGVNALNETIDENIKDRVYQLIGEAQDKDGLFEQLQKLEQAFTKVSANEQEIPF